MITSRPRILAISQRMFLFDSFIHISFLSTKCVSSLGPVAHHLVQGNRISGKWVLLWILRIIFDWIFVDMIEDQEKLLEDAKKNAKEQAYFMRKALENADLRKGLKFSSEMLAELKTSVLAPRNYYILFMTIFDYMRGTSSDTQNSKTISRRISGEAAR